MIFFAVPVSVTPKNMDLSGLKDVILMDKPSFFPPAPGWIMVFCLGLIFLLAVLYYIKKRYFPTPYEYALKELELIRKKNLTPVGVGIEISKLLKRVAIFRFGRENVADLSGKDWKQFLKEKGKKIFDSKEADFIAQSAWMPLQKEIAIPIESLYTHTKEWIKVVLKDSKNEHQ